MLNFKSLKKNTKITVPEHLKLYINSQFLIFLRYDEYNKRVYFVHPDEKKEETFFNKSELNRCKIYE